MEARINGYRAEYTAWSTPARLHGRPEDCTPEDGELEILAVFDASGNEIDPVEAGIEDEIENACWAAQRRSASL